MDAPNLPPKIDRINYPPGETGDGGEPRPTHMAYAVYRSPHYPPDWVTLGPITTLDNGHIMGRFTSTPTSAWGHEWLAVPIGETPPPLSRELPPKRPKQQSRPATAEPMQESQPLPGEEDEPQGFFSGGNETS